MRLHFSKCESRTLEWGKAACEVPALHYKKSVKECGSDHYLTLSENAFAYLLEEVLQIPLLSLHYPLRSRRLQLPTLIKTKQHGFISTMKIIIGDHSRKAHLAC